MRLEKSSQFSPVPLLEVVGPRFYVRTLATLSLMCVSFHPQASHNLGGCQVGLISQMRG